MIDYSERHGKIHDVFLEPQGRSFLKNTRSFLLQAFIILQLVTMNLTFILESPGKIQKTLMSLTARYPDAVVVVT